jgi:hypothetical protein
MAEIGMLYVYWAIREQAALGTEPTSFKGRTQVPEIALNNAKVNESLPPKFSKSPPKPTPWIPSNGVWNRR